MPRGNSDPTYNRRSTLPQQSAIHRRCPAHHLNSPALTVDHGAPLLLLVPVKLGIEELKGHYQDYLCPEEPRDYWRTWVFPLRRNLTPFNILKIQGEIRCLVSLKSLHLSSSRKRGSAALNGSRLAAAARPEHLTPEIRQLFKRNILDRHSCPIAAVAGPVAPAATRPDRRISSPGSLHSDRRRQDLSRSRRHSQLRACRYVIFSIATWHRAGSAIRVINSGHLAAAEYVAASARNSCWRSQQL